MTHFNVILRGRKEVGKEGRKEGRKEERKEGREGRRLGKKDEEGRRGGGGREIIRD